MGSTYLAIAEAVETIPPLLMIGVRCVMASPIGEEAALDRAGVSVMLCSSMCWAFGSVASARESSHSPFQVAGMQL